MTRNDQLTAIGCRINNLLTDFGRRQDILIAFCNPNEAALAEFSDWDRKRFCLLPNEEYFMVYEHTGGEYHLLYVVSVTADSLLTAADELMRLVAAKF